MKRLRSWWVWMAAAVVFALPAAAHFQVVLPSADVVTENDNRTVNLDIRFTHPMEAGPVMEMGVPKQFGVLVDGNKHDLAGSLVPTKIDGKAAYRCEYQISRPGDYVFYIEPTPYWEPAEEKLIVHYTKVVVDALDAETGWDATVGFPVEIEPLVRPYGLWTGNVFRGVVKRNGQPVPFAVVEIENYNAEKAMAAPSDPFVTQVVKADANGTFAYAIPWAGWWGFAALVDGDEKQPSPEGKLVDVELGGLIWVKAVDPQRRAGGASPEQGASNAHR